MRTAIVHRAREYHVASMMSVISPRASRGSESEVGRLAGGREQGGSRTAKGAGGHEQGGRTRMGRGAGREVAEQAWGGGTGVGRRDGRGAAGQVVLTGAWAFDKLAAGCVKVA